GCFGQTALKQNGCINPAFSQFCGSAGLSGSSSASQRDLTIPPPFPPLIAPALQDFPYFYFS
ncbi:hypothetical protein, partial [Rufibacter ruber]|uniref:hypothetical protein n=1 Tax=Rufibacter ruber TaxID=1783499 RepID=UPI0019D40EA4